MKQKRPQARLINKIRRMPDFLTKSSKVLFLLMQYVIYIPPITAQNLLVLTNNLINN